MTPIKRIDNNLCYEPLDCTSSLVSQRPQSSDQPRTQGHNQRPRRVSATNNVPFYDRYDINSLPPLLKQTYANTEPKDVSDDSASILLASYILFASPQALQSCIPAYRKTPSMLPAAAATA